MGTVKKIYLIHGWTYSTDKWQNLISLLEKAGLHVELLKVPGLTEKINRPWDLNDYVEWLAHKISPKEQAVLIGHSNGGRICLAFSLKYPTRVKHLFLMNSAGIYHNYAALRLKRFIFSKLAKVGQKFTKSIKLKKLVYKLAGESDYNQAEGFTKQTMSNLIQVDLKDQLTQVKVPTTIIWGEHDKITPVTDACTMAEKIKGARLFIIKGARHSPQFSNPEVVAKIIKETT